MTKYFAKLGLSSKVITVTGVSDKIATTEQAGIDYLNKLYNYPFWKECSKDGSIRKNPMNYSFLKNETFWTAVAVILILGTLIFGNNFV